ncbi:uncharacterized protein Tco025E_08260 [Trypanosoma conorhini]|uniref:Uncharacterized protein n=1 Tax=Trypanosoma conorhini TaxID=83891 RepID=A0A422ND42_9TRYP|nr:uncharacterized protein Tco025E_08260 [Trypanosoma conorhini]RNF03391.1 hypothetical protein Tco025E_08260 [Trypanosoma conorhini]
MSPRSASSPAGGDMGRRGFHGGMAAQRLATSETEAPLATRTTVRIGWGLLLSFLGPSAALRREVWGRELPCGRLCHPCRVTAGRRREGGPQPVLAGRRAEGFREAAE